MKDQSAPTNPAKSAALIGLGVIGSPVAQHLARMDPIGMVTLVDKDTYTASNVRSQQITPSDQGKLKVDVQAQRLREIDPNLTVVPIAAPVETVPWGMLRADVLLSALDSNLARQHVNLIARRLSIPWIDAGVEASNRLARISTYFPAEDHPCMECSWLEEYDVLEQAYPCDDGAAEPPPTDAPSSLGALAAALQALELMDFLSGRLEASSFGREVVLSASHLRTFVTSLRRNPGCRLRDHGSWAIDRLDRGPDQLTLAEALRLGPPGSTPEGDCGLRVEASMFVTKLTCPACGGSKPLLKLEAALGSEDLACPDCDSDKRMQGTGFDKIEHLGLAAMPDLPLDRTLADIGLRPGDVVSVGVPGNETHLEIGGRDE